MPSEVLKNSFLVACVGGFASGVAACTTRGGTYNDIRCGWFLQPASASRTGTDASPIALATVIFFKAYRLTEELGEKGGGLLIMFYHSRTGRQ